MRPPPDSALWIADSTMSTMMYGLRAILISCRQIETSHTLRISRGRGQNTRTLLGSIRSLCTFAPGRLRLPTKMVSIRSDASRKVRGLGGWGRTGRCSTHALPFQMAARRRGFRSSRRVASTYRCPSNTPTPPIGGRNGRQLNHLHERRHGVGPEQGLAEDVGGDQPGLPLRDVDLMEPPLVRPPRLIALAGPGPDRVRRIGPQARPGEDVVDGLGLVVEGHQSATLLASTARRTMAFLRIESRRYRRLRYILRR